MHMTYISFEWLNDLEETYYLVLNCFSTSVL